MALPSLFRSGRDRDLPARREPFEAFQREMNRLFEDFWRDPWIPSRLGGEAEFWPRMDVEETDGEVRVTAELPGLEEKDFELTLEGDRLTIRGEKRAEREDRRRGWQECSYGSFERTLVLPCEVEAEKASAEYEQGVLRVRLPKTETARERARRIPVEAS